MIIPINDILFLKGSKHNSQSQMGQIDSEFKKSLRKIYNPQRRVVPLPRQSKIQTSLQLLPVKEKKSPTSVVRGFGNARS